ncbi:uncharacterized protein P884DRAFT_279260 [Thermothelomyces heterothallicus CBS 202.75]|uniref:uncharacterized protein n=1 Tax=Thermothelomyces heterothallicus CBS 202.75 TaxID=1149848 RepID=UPI003742C88B
MLDRRGTGPDPDPAVAMAVAVAVLVALYLTDKLLRDTYARLEAHPVTTKSYAARIPPKLERRYIVTGGSGLVGGFIVLQLLERGQPPESIRVVDFRAPDRADMLRGPATRVDFVRTDISSAEATAKAFSKPWHPSVARLPLTVFHTAAVIVPSDRSRLLSGFCEAVNVRGTRNVVEAARRAGADVLVSTTSASISIRPVELWVPPWRLWSTRASPPRGYWQVQDERDFFEPLREHAAFYANYPASKAEAERTVCAANSAALRTGCIRPANGVYGNPTDNTVGGALAWTLYPTRRPCGRWTSHIVQNFVHGINVAIAHLDFEAILAAPGSESRPQAGRPFVVTDPNPPIRYGDLYRLLRTLSVTRFRVLPLQPVLMILLSYPVEWYTLALARWPALRRFLPRLPDNVKHLQPGIFSICTHLVASNDAAGRPVAQGGLGYTGVLTTLEGMTQEVVEWNRDHRDAKEGPPRSYKTSVSLADDIARAAAMMESVTGG